MFSNLRLVHFHCSLSLYFDAKATRAFVAGLFVLLFVCSPTTECVTIIPTNDLGHESKSQFNPSFCSHRPFLLRANPTWLIKTDPAFYLGLPSTSILQQSLWWWWWWWWWHSFVFFPVIIVIIIIIISLYIIFYSKETQPSSWPSFQLNITTNMSTTEIIGMVMMLM